MSSNNKTYQPALAISLKAAEDLPAFRFVSHLGSLCAAETKSIGVTELSWNDGDVASLITLGTIAVESAATIEIGDNVTSDASGKAKPATGVMAVNGRALDSADAGEFVKIHLVP